jgi:RNA polymerase sigma-70 factor (ECF subfamily)
MAGSGGGIEEVYEREAPSIRRYLATLVGSADAEDLSQEVFARAHAAAGSHRGEASLSTWIRRIATHVAIDHLRSPASRLVALAPLDQAEDAPPPRASERAAPPGQEQGLIRAEMRSCILELVHRLPAPYAEVILLGELRGLKDREVAAALGVTLEAAKIRLHRARAALRDLMLGSCDLDRDPDTGLGCDRKRPPGT